ncbi:MAG: prepilin-type N-terminal cleavage/methylation domain-containing protein [Planctomycetota bacterium]
MRTQADRERMFRRGYTLVEILIVVVIMGLAGALVAPTISSADALRGQAAVRTLVSDITFAQSDAIAMQQPRAVVFDPDANLYSLVAVFGTTATEVLVDPYNNGRRYEVSLDDPDFGGARLTTVQFSDSEPEMLVFDEFGAPIEEPGSITPIPQGVIEIETRLDRFTINVDGMTGQVWTERVSLAEAEEEGG